MRSRHDLRVRETCIVIDVILNMNNNGANEIHTKCLLYLTLSRHNHGQGQVSMAHDTAFRLASSYGSAYSLGQAISRRYLAGYPEKRRVMIENSTSRSRDVNFKLDEQGRRSGPHKGHCREFDGAR